MRIQLWTGYYEPEPTGIGPIAGAVMRSLAERGHEIDVVTAHPHYPEPRWSRPLLPSREERNGMRVWRAPLFPGRQSASRRILQEATLSASLAAMLPFLPRADVGIAVSPYFTSLAPAMLHARLRRFPWVLWLQDILPEGATQTGVLDEGPLVKAARRFERAAYRSAARIVVISGRFADNLHRKGVHPEKVVKIPNPSSRPVRSEPRSLETVDGSLALSMGNIGRSQDLGAVVEAFESSPDLERMGARLIVAGEGVAADEVRRAVRTARVEVPGLLDSPRLDDTLGRAAIGIVSQAPHTQEWNMPSRLMTFMGSGVPVVALTPPGSEVDWLIRTTGAGWSVNGSVDNGAFAAAVAHALSAPEERARRGAAGLDYARRHFTPGRVAEAFEDVLEQASGQGATAR